METISMRGINILLGIAVLAFSLGQSSVHGADLSFCCSSTNDLYKALGSKWPRYEHPDQAIRKARNGSAVLLLADGYPHQRLNFEQGLYEVARQKKLRLFVEYPASVPGVILGQPKVAEWERLVVASDAFPDCLA